MQDRFWLRFETGGRSGETVPIPPTGLTVGRNPGQPLRIVDKSVSGSHAELRVENGSVRVVDAGSRNGTRVAGERVTERLLAHGDTLSFGTVRLVFLDRELDPELDDTGPEARAVAEGGEGVRRASATNLERSGRRNAVAWIALILALLGGGFLAWQRFGPAGSAAGAPELPVEVVPGNLLAGATSFEETQGGERGWTAAVEAPAALSPGRRWRRTGGAGLGAELAAGEWALSASDPVPVPLGRALEARAHVRGDAGGAGLLGLAFLDADGVAVLTTWSERLELSGAEPVELVLTAVAPGGVPSAEVLLLARAQAEAGVGFDDVSACAVTAPEPVASFAEYELRTAGAPPRAAYLLRVESLLLGEIAWRAPAEGSGGGAPVPGLPVSAAAPLSFRATDTGLVIAASAPPPGAILSARVAAGATAGVVTTGAEGYRAHAGAFEAQGVESVLLPGEHGYARLGLAGGAGVRGRLAPGGGLLLEVSSPPGELEVQLAFGAERTRAHGLAAEAREAERGGRVGAAIGHWNELLDHYPYDPDSVRAAEAGRVKLIEQGLAAVREVEREVERAGFFALAGLFRSCRDQALALAGAYAGTEVETAALAVAKSAEEELVALSLGESRGEVVRLEAILEVLRAEGSARLADHVERNLPVESSAGSPGPEPNDGPDSNDGPESQDEDGR